MIVNLYFFKVLLFNNLLLPRGLANPAKYLKEADVLIQQSLAKYPNGSLFQVRVIWSAADINAYYVFDRLWAVIAHENSAT